ncbi:hypothetical protein JYT76_03595 [Olleya sp. AH-315-F22]|nr:hypothetical protein [Olleya sp. AH-315-F22]
MFDGFKILLKNSNHILDYNFYVEVNEKYSDGVLTKTLYKTKNNITVKYMHETDNIYLFGSFHNLKNNGVHNFDQFTYFEFLKQLEYLQREFNIDISNCNIKRLEYGVNICPPSVTKNINKGLLLHSNETPLNKRKTDFRFEHSKYEIKCYDKAIQYKLKDNLMRFERNYLYATSLHKQDIYTLQDLTNSIHLQYFNNTLLQDWNNILIYDYTIREKELTTRQRNKLKDYKNPIYWSGLNPRNRHRPKKILKEIINNHSDKLQEQIYTQIKNTLERNCTLNNGNEMHNHFKNPNILNA